MATQILMPALSPTMEEGTLAKWLVKEGDTVTSGQIIAEIETDKATMEFEAIDEGTVGKLLIDEGTEGVKVNTPIAVLLDEGEDASAVEAAAGAAGGASVGAAETVSEPEQAPAAAMPSQPAVARAEPAPEPEVPEGTTFRTQTVREALRDAMAEEMRRDGDVFLMGEEVAEYQGAYKISQGLLDEFGARRVIDTPITEHGFTGLARRRGLRRPEADRRVHDVQLRPAGDRPDHQLGREDALHVRRPDGRADGLPGSERCGRARRGPAQP